MRTRLTSVGGSVRLTVPARLVQQLRLRGVRAVDIAIQGVTLVVSPARDARPALSRMPKLRNSSQAPSVVAVQDFPATQARPGEALHAGAADGGARQRAQSWLAENRGALESSNAYIESHGLPSLDIASSDESVAHSPTNTMRLIFLDFDGVLHEARGDLEDDQFFEWAPILANALAPHPDVRVVVHSSWRHMHAPDELRGFMRGLSERYLGAVPPGPRERAIREYLRQAPHVRHYLVIDDAPKEFSRIRGRRLLICDPATGLSAPDVQQRLSAWLTDSRAAGSSSAESPRKP